MEEALVKQRSKGKLQGTRNTRTKVSSAGGTEGLHSSHTTSAVTSGSTGTRSHTLLFVAGDDKTTVQARSSDDWRSAVDNAIPRLAGGDAAWGKLLRNARLLGRRGCFLRECNIDPSGLIGDHAREHFCVIELQARGLGGSSSEEDWMRTAPPLEAAGSDARAAVSTGAASAGSSRGAGAPSPALPPAMPAAAGCRHTSSSAQGSHSAVRGSSHSTGRGSRESSAADPATSYWRPEVRTVAGHVLVSGRLLAHETRGGNTALHIQCGETRTFVFETRALEGVVLQVDYWIRALFPPHS